MLAQGKVVAIPTETVYGLAANALNESAVARIFEIKNRPAFDPLIVHLHNVQQVSSYAADFPPIARDLAEAFWPGPLTLVLPRRNNIPDIVTSGLPTVGLRIPDHALTRVLLAQIDFPLAAPSANPFGYVSPTTARHVYEQLGAEVDYILDGGPCRIGLESTIIGFVDRKPVIHRLGGISLEDIEQVAGTVQIDANASANPITAGQLKHHYAPSKQVELGNIRELALRYMGSKLAIISFSENFSDLHPTHQVILSPTGDLQEAACRLFAALREMDSIDTDVVIVERVPEQGLGRAINDRLQRAASK